MRRRLVALGAAVAGVAAGGALYRRAALGQRERVDLYFADGSMVSLGESSAGAGELLSLARSILAATRA